MSPIPWSARWLSGALILHLAAASPAQSARSRASDEPEGPQRAWGQTWYPSVDDAIEALGEGRSAAGRRRRPQLVAAFRVLGDLRGGT